MRRFRHSPDTREAQLSAYDRVGEEAGSTFQIVRTGRGLVFAALGALLALGGIAWTVYEWVNIPWR